MECRGIVEASWQTPDLPSEVGSVLNKIEECGRRLKSWNMKKRGELRADLRRKREAVIAASKGQIEKAYTNFPPKYGSSVCYTFCCGVPEHCKISVSLHPTVLMKGSD
ncbi:hypothetical protein LWI28_015642 [Acer negundo]|uniref:Uncharacterized protein n=1 Tax=Acer negundo TaxID=4023 RepID=A0AAD5IEH6_ACENE|nr:hypothetical protein LWI28_015642 [Acer negundo]